MPHHDPVLTESDSAESTSGEAVRDSPSHGFLGLVLVGLVSGCFIGAWFNQYAPAVAGGDAVLMNLGGGYLPYRDYFSQAPPGVPMLVQAIASVGGPHLIATLAFGA